jgi:CheY-like chemotaxis protein
MVFNRCLMKKMNVLIVEDDVNSREGLKAILIYGYSVDTSEDGLQGIKRIKEKIFDVAVIDIDLPLS